MGPESHNRVPEGQNGPAGDKRYPPAKVGKADPEEASLHIIINPSWCGPATPPPAHRACLTWRGR